MKGAVVLITNADSVMLLARRSPSLQVVWLTCGKTRNKALRAFLADA